MREFLMWLFEKRKEPEIALFSGWHFMYIGLILGLTFLAVYILRNKKESTKITATKVICYTLIITICFI